MHAVAARLNSKYQVVIPKQIREILRLGPQDSVLFLVDGDTVVLRRQPANLTAALRGLHQDLWSEPDDWLEEERASWEARLISTTGWLPRA